MPHVPQRQEDSIGDLNWQNCLRDVGTLGGRSGCSGRDHVMQAGKPGRIPGASPEGGAWGEDRVKEVVRTGI